MRPIRIARTAQARIVTKAPESAVSGANPHFHRIAAHSGLLAAAALVLCACAPTPSKPAAAPPPVNLSGYSAAFKEGFKDGCDSARGSGRRDEKRFGADTQYAQGWQDGRAICGKRQ